MKNRQFVLVVALLLTAVGCVYLFRKNFKVERRHGDEGIFATSTKGNLTRTEVEKYIANLKKNFGQTISLSNMKDEEKKILANEIFNGRIILERAKAEGIGNSKEYIERLNSMKEDLLKLIFLENLVTKNVSDEMVKAKYEELVASMKDKKEYEISYIFAKEEKDINQIMKELEDRTFADVAANYSQDPTSKNNGGRIGWIIESALTSEFGSTVKKLPINKLSKPFKADAGWYLMLKTGERNAVIPKFEDAKSTLRNAAVRDFIKNYGISNTENLDVRLVD
ncbi:MAG: peptidylprolyl isomerase [Rickettsiales bacterium]|jgi:peptidyl-prolyl cis-trans isomerase C|nr:peptidylprolyl isomerase [Rickettsiales bacterium]